MPNGFSLQSGSLPLFPQTASTLGAQVDHLYFFLLAIAGFFSTLIFFLIFYFAIRYRRRSASDRAEQIAGSLPLEIVWTAIPLAIAMMTFVWGAKLYFLQAKAPDDAADIYVVAKQGMWKLQHAEGPMEINELHVPAGRPFRLVMTSQDAIHSLFVPAFRMKKDVVPGRYTTQWFEATTPGDYHLFCTQYCGTSHSRMVGWIHVMEPVAYERWLSGGSSGESMQVAGGRLFEQLGCSSCHLSDGTGRGPTLDGLYGSKVQIEGGRTVVADDGYIQESILNPAAKVTAGYQPIMPTFQGQVSEESLFQLLAYVKSRAPVPGKGPPR
jgi:cytochrome c oxidase subunit 2